MRRLHYHLYSGMVFAFLGLLASCGTTTLATPTVPVPTRQSGIPTDVIAQPIATPLPYPAPNTLQAPPPTALTNDQLDGGSGYPIRSDHQAPTIFGSLPAPQLGVVVDKHMRVLGVAAYSAAETAGIQLGDILDTLDGIPILSHTQTVKDLIHTAQEDQAMHLRLIRNNISLEVIVVPFSSQRRIGPTLEPGQIPPTSTPVAAPDHYL